MSRLAIEFPSKYIDNYGNTENLERQAARPEQLYMWDGTTITYEQASPCLSDALQLLGQLRTNSAAKALDRLKNSNPDFPPFSFQIHKYLGPTAESFGGGELPVQPFQQNADPNQVVYPGSSIAETEQLGPSYASPHSSSPYPPIETIDLSLLMAQEFDSDNLSQHAMCPEAEDNGPLFVPPISDDVLAPGTPDGDSGPQVDSFCDRKLSVQPFQQGTNPNLFLYPGSPIAGTEGSGLGDVTLPSALSLDPPAETIDTSLLMGQIADSDNFVSRDVLYSEDDAGISNWNALDTECNGSLFVSPVNDGTSQLATPNRRTPPFGDTAATSLRSDPSENSSPTSNSLVPGVPTPESDHVSPTAQPPKGTDHPRHSERSKLSNITKETNTRQNSKKRKSLEADQRNKRKASELEKLKQSISSLPVANTLHGLSEKDLRALLLGEGLIKDDLLECLDQNSRIWREKGFWIEEALDLFITTDHSAEEKFCQVFRHARTVAKRGSGQELRLLMSEALLYLSSKSLKQVTQQDIRLKMLDNPRRQRASTLSIDRLLERSYPNLWDSMDIKAKRSLRAQLHEHLRNGSRCWQVAGPLGLGAPFTGGNLLIKMIKNHSKYTIPKLDAIINYIINAHPHVVSLYHDFDGLVKQILHIKPLATQPSRQVVAEKLSLLPRSRLTQQQIEERWESVDSVALSKGLIEKLLLSPPQAS